MGDAFADRFVVKEPVGSGAMGTVYRGWDLLQSKQVAIKLQNPKSLREEHRLEREAQLLAELSHPAIVRYVAHGTKASGERYLAMEWLEGETLESRLSRQRMTAQESIVLASMLLDGIAAAHRAGVVHRDIKPGNILLPDGQVERVKITDFGIAVRVSETERLTHPGIIVGTPLYMSPEQARGDASSEPKSDVFSVGCVLYECLTGQPPFTGLHVMAILAKIVLQRPAGLRTLRPELPESLESLLDRMLSKTCSERPDARTCLAELSYILAELDGAVAPADRGPGRRRTESRALAESREQRVLCIVLVGREHEAPSPTPTFLRERATLDASISPGIQSPGIAEMLDAYGARLDRLFDGSMVVTFSGSHDATEEALAAARCALALRELLPERTIALCTGRAVINGELPFGAVIDAGARLVDMSVPGVVQLDDATAALLAGRFGITPAGDRLFLGDEGAEEEEPRTLLGTVTPTVGRERDLELIESVFDDCQGEPSAHAVVVTGPAGGGKTRLRHELLRRLREREEPFELLLGRGDSIQGGSPFSLLGPAMRKLAGIAENNTLETRREKVRAMVGADVATDKLRRVTAFIGELMGVPFPDDESLILAAARQEPRLMADQILASWLDWLEAVCATRTVLFVLEDLHFGDLPSVQLLDAALRALERRPLMVLGLARPEIDQRFPGLFRQRELLSLQLGKLPKKACERLVEEVLGAQLSAEKRAWLVDRADGNAFYLEELIRAVAVGAPDAELPDTVLGMLQARLDALGDDGKRILRAASVFGERFRDEGVRVLLGGEQCEVAVEPWLTTLVKQEMIFSKGGATPGEYGFRHALLRDAAYATLTEDDRALGHRLAGEWLEQHQELQPLVLADHFERGCAPARAAMFYRAAAEKALEANDLALVIECANRGVGQGAAEQLRGELAGLKAEAHQWRGEVVESAVAATDAMRWLEKESAGWYRSAAVLAMAYCRQGNADAAAATCDEMLAAAADSKLDTSRMISMILAAGDVMLIGRLALAESMIERIQRECADGNGEGTLLGNVHAAEAMIAIVKFSDPSSCLRHARAALARFERAGDLRSNSWQLVNVGFALIELGVYGEAETALREAAAQADRIGIAPIAASARQNLGMALLFQGRLDSAEIALNSAMDSFRTQGDVRQEATCRMYMARLLLTAGRLRHAEAEARRAVDLSESLPGLKTTALATLACALFKQSRTHEALVAARSAVALLETTGSVEGESFVRLVHARALQEAGEDDEARVALDEAERRVLERAQAISDPSLRQSFLENVPDNRDVLTLAAQLRVARREALPDHA